MYEAAIKLIKKGKAYVSDLNADEIREYRGTLKEPGKEDPYASRSVEENLKLFGEMKEGKCEDGSRVLRARIDMSSSNINMRDPILYRVAHMTHHNTGDKWCIYPMYDFHTQSRMQSKELLIPSARLSLRITDRFMTGLLPSLGIRQVRMIHQNRSSLQNYI